MVEQQPVGRLVNRLAFWNSLFESASRNSFFLEKNLPPPLEL